MVRPGGPFHFAVELRGSGIEVDMPVKLHLEFMTSIRANEGPIYACTGGSNPVIARQVPDDSLWTEGVSLPELEDLLDGLNRMLISKLRILGRTL